MLVRGYLCVWVGRCKIVAWPEFFFRKGHNLVI